jgi:hypothetical protein
MWVGDYPLTAVAFSSGMKPNQEKKEAGSESTQDLLEGLIQWERGKREKKTGRVGVP